MIQRLLAISSLLVCLCFAACQSARSEGPHGAQVVHHVYFTLRDDTDAAREALVAACEAGLADLPGITYFSAGARDESIDGAANDRDFDVALLVVFEDRGAFDRYLKAPRHLAFVEAQKSNWQLVRVFDARDGPR